jgi:hypothetical protein
MATQIGFLHTTALSDKMKEDFINGLQSTGKWPTGTFTIEASNKEGKYGNDASGNKLTDLDKAAKDYGDRGFQLIVAAGLAAVIAAHKDGRVPTVGLIGRLPKQQTEPGWKAINETGTNVKCISNMDTASHNMERRDKLAGPPFNVPIGDIALMINTNSAMGDNEHDECVGPSKIAIGVKYPDLTGKKDNDHAHFKAFFENVPTQVKAIVVSSDPFFFRFRSRLIRGADAARPSANFKFCFPFAEWKFQDDGSTVIKPWNDMRHIGFCGSGIDLLPSYKKLGVCALNTLP